MKDDVPPLDEDTYSALVEALSIKLKNELIEALDAAIEAGASERDTRCLGAARCHALIDAFAELSANLGIPYLTGLEMVACRSKHYREELEQPEEAIHEMLHKIASLNPEMGHLQVGVLTGDEAAAVMTKMGKHQKTDPFRVWSNLDKNDDKSN